MPFTTTDPSGAGALFYVDLTGGQPSAVVFTSAFATVRIDASTPGGNVAEPGSLPLVFVALVAVLLGGSRVARTTLWRKQAAPLACGRG